MATIRRGSSHYISSEGATSHSIPLPAGSQVDDWVILGAVNTSWSAIFTLPGVEILNAGSNTMHYGLSKKRLTAEDVAAGQLAVGISSAQGMAAICIGYSDASGFGVVGTVWTKDTQNLNYTQAPAAVSDGEQDILVFSLIKHSAAGQVFIDDSPSTISLETALQTGTGVASAHVGVYTGSSADRTSRWEKVSTNGVGFQIAVLPSNSPSLPIFSVKSGAAIVSVETIGVKEGSNVNSVEILGVKQGLSIVPVN